MRCDRMCLSHMETAIIDSLSPCCIGMIISVFKFRSLFPDLRCSIQLAHIEDRFLYKDTLAICTIVSTDQHLITTVHLLIKICEIRCCQFRTTLELLHAVTSNTMMTWNWLVVTTFLLLLFIDAIRVTTCLIVSAILHLILESLLGLLVSCI